MITLGLDPSLTGLGWVVHNSSCVGPARVEAKGVVSTPSSWLWIRRYIYLREAVRELFTAYAQIMNVGVESPPFGEQWSEGLYGLSLFVTEAIYDCRKDLVFFDPATVKSLAKMDSSIRKGSMDKGDMIEASKIDTTIKKWNHNEADAYIIARSAARFWEALEGTLLEDELTPAERQVFLKKKTISKGPRKGLQIVRGLIYREGDRFFRFSSSATSAP